MAIPRYGAGVSQPPVVIPPQIVPDSTPGAILSRILSTVLVAAITAGCGSAPPGPVSLDGTWPDRPAQLDDATRTWTRRGDSYAPLSQHKNHLLEVHATLKAPAWRTAYAHHLARQQGLSSKARAELIERERAADNEAYEVELVVATYDRQTNDLQKNLKSHWHIALTDADGNRVRPLSIKRDRRPSAEIRAVFPPPRRLPHRVRRPVPPNRFSCSDKAPARSS